MSNRTNIEKYENYLEKLVPKANEYITYLFPDGIPNKIYCIIFGRDGNHRFNIIEADIYSITYSFDIPETKLESKYYKDECSYDCVDKITRSDIKNIKLFVDNVLSGNYEYNEDRVIVRSEHFSRSLLDIKCSTWISFVREDLIDKLNRMNSQFESKEGYVKCAYCNRYIKSELAISGYILSPSINDLRSESRYYCNNSCNYCDQMKGV